MVFSGVANCVCSFQRILKLFILVDLRDFMFGKKEEKKTEENLFLGDFLVFSCVLFSSG